MSKVFELPVSLGSLRDKHGDFVMTNTGSTKIVRTSKGKALEMDGSSQYLTHSIANFRSADSQGAIFIRFKTNDISGEKSLFASTDTGTDTSYISFSIADDDLRIRSQNTGGTVNVIDTSTSLVKANVFHHAILVSTGTAWKLYLDGVDQGLTVTSGSNVGDWFADITLRDNITVGSVQMATPFGYFFGNIGEVEIVNHVPTQAEITASYNRFLVASNIEPPMRGFRFPGDELDPNATDLVTGYQYTGVKANKLADITGSNQATIIGTPQSGKYGLQLNGSSGMNINTVNTALASTTKGTFVCMVKPIDSTPSASETFISFADTSASTIILLGIQTDGTLRCLVRNSSANKWLLVTDNKVFYDDQETHVVIAQDGVNPVMYINGIAVAQTFTVSTDKTFWFNGFSTLDNGRIGFYDFNGAGPAQYFNGTIRNVEFYDDSFDSTRALDNYSNYTKDVYLDEYFQGEGADGVNKLPTGWAPGTGSYKIAEDAGGKYMQCTSNGTISIEAVALDSVANKGVMTKLEYYDGATWSDVGGVTVDAAISANAWLSYSNGHLVFTLTSGDRIRSIVIKRT